MYTGRISQNYSTVCVWVYGCVHECTCVCTCTFMHVHVQDACTCAGCMYLLHVAYLYDTSKKAFWITGIIDLALHVCLFVFACDDFKFPSNSHANTITFTYCILVCVCGAYTCAHLQVTCCNLL